MPPPFGTGSPSSTTRGLYSLLENGPEQWASTTQQAATAPNWAMPPKRRLETCRPIRPPAPRPPCGNATGIAGAAAALDADRIAPDSSAATFPVVSISPLDRGSNGAGVWFIRNTKHLGRQTALTASVESKSFLAAVATLPAPSLHRRCFCRSSVHKLKLRLVNRVASHRGSRPCHDRSRDHCCNY